MKKTLLTILAALALAVPTAVSAEETDSVVVRPASVSVMLDAGHVRSLDTYISPLFYNGAHTRISFERLRATRFNPERWVGRLSAGLTLDSPSNPAGNNSLYSLLLDADYSMMYRWTLPHNFSVYAGPDLGFVGGANYNTRNSNNVVSPQIRLYVGASGRVAWRTHLRRLPLTLNFQTVVPVLGGFFLPDYDQSFYEIYLGNYKNTVNFGYWGNRFDINNTLSADFHFGTTSLRIGYRNEFATVWKNNISQRLQTHSFVIGVQWEAIRLNQRYGKIEKAKIISAIY